MVLKMNVIRIPRVNILKPIIKKIEERKRLEKYENKAGLGLERGGGGWDGGRETRPRSDGDPDHQVATRKGQKSELAPGQNPRQDMKPKRNWTLLLAP